MSIKAWVWTGMFVGSTAGGFLPALWGGDIFASLIWSALGGLAGIWAGFKMAQRM